MGNLTEQFVFGVEARTAGLAMAGARANLEVANRGCVYASLITLYAFGGWLVKTGRVTVGSLIAAVGYTFGLIFATQVSHVSHTYSTYSNTRLPPY